MEIRYTYTYQDYEALCQARARNLPRYSMRKWSIWVLVFMNISASIWMISSDLAAGRGIGPSGIVFGTVAVILLVVHFFLSPWSRRRAFQNQLLDASETVVTIDESGLASKNDAGESRVNWSGIIRADNEPEHVIFWSSHIVGIAIPKSAINDAEMQEIDRLVNEHVIEHDNE